MRYGARDSDCDNATARGQQSQSGQPTWIERAGQSLAQPRPRACEALAHDFGRHAILRRDLERREAIVVAAHDRREARFLERRERIDEGAQDLAPRGKVDGGGQLFAGCRDLLASVASCLLATPVAGHPAQDGSCPGSQAADAPLWLGRPLQREQAGALQDVVGHVRVARQPAGERAHPPELREQLVVVGGGVGAVHVGTVKLPPEAGA
jgi:hypothetical protein